MPKEPSKRGRTSLTPIEALKAVYSDTSHPTYRRLAAKYTHKHDISDLHSKLPGTKGGQPLFSRLPEKWRPLAISMLAEIMERKRERLAEVANDPRHVRCLRAIYIANVSRRVKWLIAHPGCSISDMAKEMRDLKAGKILHMVQMGLRERKVREQPQEQVDAATERRRAAEEMAYGAK